MAGKIKGITIEIGGNTSKLDKALKSTNDNIKSTQSELRQVERLLKLDPTNTELLAQKQEILAKAIGNTKEKLDTLKEASKQVQKQFEKGEISEEQFRELNREIVATENSLKRMEESAKSVGKSLKKSLNDAGKSLKDFGGKIKGAGEAFTPISAVAGGALTGFVGLGIKAAQSADDINTLSKQTGLSVEEIQKFKYATELIDVPLETLTGSMSKLTKGMGDAKRGTGTAKKAFEDLGISILDSEGNLRSNQDVFAEAIGKLSEIENATQRDAIAMELFGKSAQDLNPLIMGGAEALEELGKQAEDSGLILSEETLNNANEFNDAIDTLKATVMGTLMKVGAQIAEVLTPLLETLGEKLSAIFDFIGSLDSEVVTIIMTILGVVAAIAPLLIVIGQVVTLVGTISSALPVLGAILTALTGPIGIVIGVVGALIAAFVALYKNNEEFKAKVDTIWTSIKDFMAETFEQIKELARVFLEIVKSFWDKHGESIIRIVNILFDVLAGIFKGAFKVIQGILDVFIGLFTGDWDRMKEGAIKIFKGLWDVVYSVIEGAWNLISEPLGNLWNNIKEWFSSLATSAWDWGVNMIQGFIDGISSMIDSVSSAVSSVTSAAAEYIGFNSPSEKGEGRHIVEWGYNMVDGFIEGMNKAMPELNKSVNALIPEIDVNLSDEYGGSGKYGKSITQNITINSTRPLSPSETAKEINKINKRMVLA